MDDDNMEHLKAKMIYFKK